MPPFGRVGCNLLRWCSRNELSCCARFATLLNAFTIYSNAALGSSLVLMLGYKCMLQSVEIILIKKKFLVRNHSITMLYSLSVAHNTVLHKR